MHDAVPPGLIPFLAGFRAHSPAILPAGVTFVPEGEAFLEFILFSAGGFPFEGSFRFFVFVEAGAGIQTGGHAEAAEEEETGASEMAEGGSFHGAVGGGSEMQDSTVSGGWQSGVRGWKWLMTGHSCSVAETAGVKWSGPNLTVGRTGGGCGG